MSATLQSTRKWAGTVVKAKRENSLFLEPFILVYRIAQRRVEILRLLHGAQNWPPAD